MRKTGHKSDIRIFISKLREDESRMDSPTEEKRESAGRREAEQRRGRVPGSEEQSSPEGRKDETGREQPKKEDDKKSERKIIGKIVKAGQGTRVQVKTMMGGAAISEEDEKKTSIDGKSVGRTEEQKTNEKKPDARKVEDCAEFRGRYEGAKAAAEHRKDRRIKEVEKDGQSTAEAKKGLKDKTQQRAKEQPSQEKVEKTEPGQKEDEKRRRTDEKREEARTAKKSERDKGAEQRSRRRRDASEEKDKTDKSQKDGMDGVMRGQGTEEREGKPRGRKRTRPDGEKGRTGSESKPQKKIPEQTEVAVETRAEGRRGRKKAGRWRKSERRTQTEEEGQEAARSQTQDAEEEKDGKTTEEERRGPEPGTEESSVGDREDRKTAEVGDTQQEEKMKPEEETEHAAGEQRGEEPEQKKKASKKRAAEAGTTEEEDKDERRKKSPEVTPTDSTLHRIHGEIRISLKTDKPVKGAGPGDRRGGACPPGNPVAHLSSSFQDIEKCLTALDQLSLVYLTSKHVQRHSELVVTLRKVGHLGHAPSAGGVWPALLTCLSSAAAVLQSQPQRDGEGLHALQPLQTRLPAGGGGGAGQHHLPALPAGGEGGGGGAACRAPPGEAAGRGGRDGRGGGEE